MASKTQETAGASSSGVLAWGLGLVAVIGIAGHVFDPGVVPATEGAPGPVQAPLATAGASHSGEDAAGAHGSEPSLPLAAPVDVLRLAGLTDTEAGAAQSAVLSTPDAATVRGPISVAEADLGASPAVEQAAAAEESSAVPSVVEPVVPVDVTAGEKHPPAGPPPEAVQDQTAAPPPPEPLAPPADEAPLLAAPEDTAAADPADGRAPPSSDQAAAEWLPAAADQVPAAPANEEPANEEPADAATAPASSYLWRPSEAPARSHRGWPPAPMPPNGYAPFGPVAVPAPPLVYPPPGLGPRPWGDPSLCPWGQPGCEAFGVRAPAYERH